MGRPRVLDHEEIVRLYQENKTTEEIGQLVGCSGRQVREVVSSRNIPKRSGHRKNTLDHVAIIEAYESGKSAEQVATEFSCSKAGVWHILALHGVPTREGAKRHTTQERLGFEPTVVWLQRELDKHQTAAAVARANDIPYGTLIEWMMKLGVGRPVWRGGPGPAGSPVRQDIPIKEAIELSKSGVVYRVLANKYNVSYGVIVRRMKEASHRAPRDKHRKHPTDVPYANAPYQHRKIMHELGIIKCEICGEGRALDFCHIVARKNGGPTAKENCLVLCPLHHRLYDTDKLDVGESATICRKVRKARKLYCS